MVVIVDQCKKCISDKYRPIQTMDGCIMFIIYNDNNNGDSHHYHQYDDDDHHYIYY